MKFKPGLLTKIIIAIAIILGVLSSFIFPESIVRFFVTINSIFSNFLGFVIPLIILGLVAPGIAELGKGAGKLLGITTLIAYGSTIFSGFFSFFTTKWSLPILIEKGTSFSNISDMTGSSITPYFTIDMPPVMSVTASLILAFLLGLGLTAVKGDTFKNALLEFRELITMVIVKW